MSEVKYWKGDDVTFLNGMNKVSQRLEKLRDVFKAAAEKKRKKIASKLGEYQTEADIQNAYGYAEITDAERIALLQLLNESKETLVAEDAAVCYINALLRDLKLDRDDWIENMARKKRQKCL